MSVRLPAPASSTAEASQSTKIPRESHPDDCSSCGSCSDSESGSSDDEDQTWDDWVESDSEKQQRQCVSLFDANKVLPSAEDALKHDASVHGFDLNAVCAKLGLDFHGRVRLINYLRKNKPTLTEALAITGTEEWFKQEEYLVPVLENDPLLQSSSNDDDWSDDDADETDLINPPSDPVKKVQWLEAKLALAQQKLVEYHDLLSKRLEVDDIVKQGGSDEGKKVRDDDTHYFQSYAENDIHAVMINDKVRTSTYAHFILTSPTLFQDATVLDVGCGTGILSLFAARAGAKRVISVDASDIAEKAEKIVKANGMDHIITVVRGKVEEIKLPEGVDKVDVIISEWMGYALLYESMLDSVLYARDRYLKEGGVMAPSQCQMMLGLCDASEIHKERIGFWDDVYGFDMSVMAGDLYDEAIIDVVGPEALLSEPVVIKDLLLGEITTRQLDFSSPFKLVSKAPMKSKITALVLYFDTFFTVSGKPIPEDTKVKFVKEGEAVLAELWPVGGRPAPQRRQSVSVKKDKVTSFSTGPQSTPTHWKQTIFMLREPFWVHEGTVVTGTFYCHKSATNSRELNAEIHYSVHTENGPGPTIVQMYNIR